MSNPFRKSTFRRKNRLELWTDLGAEALEYFGASAGRARKEAPSPAGPSEVLLASFFAPGKARRLHLEGTQAPDGFPLVLLIEDAPRSNLDLLSDLHREGVSLPDGLVCAAVKGKGFLGRHDRTWQCDPGNLHAVIHLKPDLPLDRVGCGFSILPARACADGVRARAVHAPPPEIKWINDLYSGPRKFAGFLTRQTYKAPRITEVFLGIGVNIGTDPALAKNPFVTRTGCLEALYPGQAWFPGTFLLDLLDRILFWYGRLREGGIGELLAPYRASSNVLGRSVRIYEDGVGFGDSGLADRNLLARGEIEWIMDDLSLKIRGLSKPIPSGRLAFEEDCPDIDAFS